MLRPNPLLSFVLMTLVPLSVAPHASSSRAATAFDLASSNVADFSTWHLNQRMEFTFTDPVDFASVNADTIRISDASGVVAVGEFSLQDPLTVAFQPACPTQPGFADAGLQPGRNYTIFLPGVGQGGPTVTSTAAVPLRQSHTIHFRTLASTDPALLFVDGAAGPPHPVIATSSTQTDACYLELSDNPDHRVYFTPLGAPDPELGAFTPAGFRSPLNLYSDVRSHVVFVIQLDQSIDATRAHLNTATVALEYQATTSEWLPLPHSVALGSNCTTSGATVRLSPLGILPQGRLVRAVLEPGFADITGDAIASPLTVASFPVGTAVDPGTINAGDGADEVFEDFVVGGNQSGSLEDTSAPTDVPHALWGNDGKLSAAFAFGGTGGPGGNFNWEIGFDTAAPPVTFVLDTTFTVISNVEQTLTENVVNGVVDVHDFILGANGKLIIQGPNPCKILVTGKAVINGQIIMRGTNNPGVQCFSCGNTVSLGAPGVAGGGNGGVGNPLTNQSSPAGLPGFGAFNVPSGGGGGGETGYALGDENLRRGGGGGGGALGADVTYMATVPFPVHACPDQSSIGLDVEAGFGGPAGGNGALSPIGTPPHGGAKGQRPFFDNVVIDGETNDFWGTMLTQAHHFIQGELAQPWAGAGGGGGGNACDTTNFPTTPWTPDGDEKGAGGGGGGGSITILALGDIVIGESVNHHGSGLIDASGGTGGGGENTNNLNHVGAGSGGGSGGHVILQSGGIIDFTTCRTTTNPPGGVYAIGGQGGEGFLAQIGDGAGGAQGGFTTTPSADALPPNAYPSTSPSTPCRMLAGIPPGAPVGTVVYTSTNMIGDSDPTHVVIGGGGDGGPGIIQLHVKDLANIKPPTTAGQTFYKILKPPPIGTNLSTINASPVGHWDQLLPAFNRFSQSQSKWIPLGAASVNPETSARDQVQFKFAGTTNGIVDTYAPLEIVPDLPPVFSGTIAAAPTTPYIAADLRTVVISGGALSDDIYTRNANLVKQFKLLLIHGSTPHAFDVGSASYDPDLGQLRVTVSAGGTPFAGLGVGDHVDLIPRFFRVSTDGQFEYLPTSSQIKIEFQAAPQDASAQPDVGQTSPWVTDITQLNTNPSYRFVRFRVSFDVDAGGQPLAPEPVPSLEFFRMPFRF